MNKGIILTDRIPADRIPFPENPLPPILVIEKYFTDELESVTDDDTKKIIAAAAIIKQKLYGLDNFSYEEMTHIADAGVSTAKVAYKVGAGTLDPTSAADYLVDKATARVGTIIDTTCKVWGEKAGQYIGGVIGSIFGPTGIVLGITIGGTVGKYAGKAVGEYIVPGIKKVASFAKKTLHAAWEGAKSVASGVLTGIKNLGESIFSFFS
ncbi:MAG: hypothetical protein LBT59_21315 [Clostridiales bacterium]|jgi:phage-related protein|nr:hypothetical protein [Clostridiales bacterium]